MNNYLIDENSYLSCENRKPLIGLISRHDSADTAIRVVELCAKSLIIRPLKAVNDGACATLSEKLNPCPVLNMSRA